MYFFIDKTIKVEWDEEIIPYNSSSFDNQKSLLGFRDWESICRFIIEI